MLEQRMPRLEIPALTKLARGMPCMFRIPGVCNGDPRTTVWCHSNTGDDGHGMSQKSDDFSGAFGCSACHRYIDEPKNSQEADFLFKKAKRRTDRFCWDNKIFRVDEKAANAIRHFS